VLRVFRRILSDILFAIGVLWQLFVILGVSFSNQWVEDFGFVILCSLMTVGVLYVSLKIRSPHPVKTKEADAPGSDDA
jgi:hypothetical protein